MRQIKNSLPVIITLLLAVALVFAEGVDIFGNGDFLDGFGNRERSSGGVGEFPCGGIGGDSLTAAAKQQ